MLQATHFTDEEIEAWSGEVLCPRSHNEKVMELSSLA